MEIGQNVRPACRRRVGGPAAGDRPVSTDSNQADDNSASETALLSGGDAFNCRTSRVYSPGNQYFGSLGVGVGVGVGVGEGATAVAFAVKTTDRLLTVAFTVTAPAVLPRVNWV